MSEEIDRIFEPIADAVLRFAHDESLCVEKCPRGNFGWELIRPHILGGTLYLLLLYESSIGLGIGSVWQFPCEEMSLLYSHFRAMRACCLNPQDVAERLKDELKDITHVRFGYWTHIAPLRTSS